MPAPLTADIAIYAITAGALAGVVLRPRAWPEAVWAVGGAVLLVVSGLLGWREAAAAVGKGINVYLFLAGMMLLSELARHFGLFDWLAAWCVRSARGSARRLFLLLYAAGTVVTVFMSNDATAVVLTPAVLAVSRRARATPLPYLLACALVANAASFVLPISNPANLVIFCDRLPTLGAWLVRFSLPSLLAIGTTYGVLRWLHREALSGRITEVQGVALQPLSAGGRMAGVGVVLTALTLLAASALDLALGPPTLLAAGAVWVGISLRTRESPWPVLKGIAWSVLALVAGLFVLVEGLQQAGLLAALTGLVREGAASSPLATAVAAGTAVALASNLMNNLPAGLIAGSVVASAGVSPTVLSGVAIGIDLGPNLSVTGSLATILWLVAIRREGERVSAAQFLRTGAIAMPAALALALLGLVVQTLLAG